MPFNPAGNYTLPDGYLGVDGQPILTSQHNPPLQDIQAALNLALLRDGRAPMTDDLNMNTFKAINVANGTNSTDAINLSQLTNFVVTSANSILFDINNKIIQFGATAVTTNGLGQGTVTFPTTFSSVPNTVIAINGNSAAALNDIVLNQIISGSGFTFQTNPVLVSAPIQANWIAIGDRT